MSFYKKRTLWSLFEIKESPIKSNSRSPSPLVRRVSSTYNTRPVTDLKKAKDAKRNSLYVAAQTRNKSVPTLGFVSTTSEADLSKNETTKTQIEEEKTSIEQSSQSLPLKKTLKKLYTASMHKQFSSKLEALKKRYEHIYTNVIKNSEVDVQREKIRNIVLKSEGLFTSTYSVKYFGVKDDQVGILSKRLWLNQKALQDRQVDSLNISKFTKTTEKSGANKKDASRSDEIYNLSESFHHVQENKKLQSLEDNMKKFQGVMNEIEEQVQEEKSENLDRDNILAGIEHNRKDEEIHKEAEKTLLAEIEEKSKPSTKVNEKNVQDNNVKRSLVESVMSIAESPSKKTLELEIKTNEKGSLQEDLDENASMNNNYTLKSIKGSTFEPPEPKVLSSLIKGLNKRDSSMSQTSLGADNYMITKYFVPRKLQVQKRIVERKGKVKGLPEAREQMEVNAVSFERICKSLPKVRRNMLRNVTTNVDEEDSVESSALEDLKTHEMKQNKVKMARFSYSGLLKSIHSTNISVDSFKDKNKTLEKLIKKRKEGEESIGEKRDAQTTLTGFCKYP